MTHSGIDSYDYDIYKVGIRRGLLVTMPGYKREFPGSNLWMLISGLAWSLCTCVALWRPAYGPSATERPLGTITSRNMT